MRSAGLWLNEAHTGSARAHLAARHDEHETLWVRAGGNHFAAGRYLSEIQHGDACRVDFSPPSAICTPKPVCTALGVGR